MAVKKLVNVVINVVYCVIVLSMIACEVFPPDWPKTKCTMATTVSNTKKKKKKKVPL